MVCEQVGHEAEDECMNRMNKRKIQHVVHQRCSTPNQNPDNQREQKRNELKKEPTGKRGAHTETTEGTHKKNRPSNRLLEKITYHTNAITNLLQSH